VKAATVDDGMSVRHLTEAAGPPTRRQEPSPACVSKGGHQALVYESRILWLGGWLGSDLSQWLVICVDDSGKIITKDAYAQ